MKKTTRSLTNYAYAYGYLDSAVQQLVEGLELEFRVKGIDIDSEVLKSLKSRVNAARSMAVEAALKDQVRFEQC